MDYAQKLVFNSNTRISLLDINNLSKTNFVLESAFNNLENKFPDNVSVVNESLMKKEFLSKQDLMIITLDSWKKLLEAESNWLANVPSVLILKH